MKSHENTSCLRLSKLIGSYWTRKSLKWPQTGVCQKGGRHWHLIGHPVIIKNDRLSAQWEGGTLVCIDTGPNQIALSWSAQMAQMSNAKLTAATNKQEMATCPQESNLTRRVRHACRQPMTARRVALLSTPPAHRLIIAFISLKAHSVNAAGCCCRTTQVTVRSHKRPSSSKNKDFKKDQFTQITRKRKRGLYFYLKTQKNH